MVVHTGKRLLQQVLKHFVWLMDHAQTCQLHAMKVSVSTMESADIAHEAEVYLLVNV